MVAKVEMYKDVPRTGSFLLAQGLERDHSNLKETIEKYREDFEEIASLARRKLRSTGGRAANEYMLTFEQVLFLVSLIRNGALSVAFVKGIILKKDIIAAYEAIKGFDTDDIKVRYVYAAVDKSGRVKIGISNSPEDRVRNLNIGNADELTLVYTKRADLPGYQSEIVLHKQCEAYRIRSEWFKKEALEVINGDTNN